MGSLNYHLPHEKHLKSRNPALKIPRTHEVVATDTVYSDTSAIDSGVKMAQLSFWKSLWFLTSTQ